MVTKKYWQGLIPVFRADEIIRKIVYRQPFWHMLVRLSVNHNVQVRQVVRWQIYDEIGWRHFP